MQKKDLSASHKIIFTGSHARSTAYAVIQEIKKRHENWLYYWVGNKDVFAGSHLETLEKKMFPKIGVKFLPIVSGRIQRKFTVWTIPELFKIPIGFLWAFYYLLKIKPSVVISFGGFAAFPIVVTAKVFGVPILIHEQTIAAGRSNILSSKLADIIALARIESGIYFDPKKSVVTGNPVSREVRGIKVKNKLSKTPVLFVTGGASGSVKINIATREILNDLLTSFSVLHQTGSLQYEEFSKFKNTLPANLQLKYFVYPTIFPWEWHRFLAKADIIVSRSGANIVSEIMIVKRPAVLIPLAFSVMSEQLKNAQAAQTIGIATILEERDLTGKNLLLAINKTKSSWGDLVKNSANAPSPDRNAHSKVTDLIEKLIEAHAI